jgi:hypothetical protein
VRLLTGTLSSTVGDGLGSLDGVAGLLSAIADAVCPVALGAEAVGVTSAAHEVGRGNAGHVVNTHLLWPLAFRRPNNGSIELTAHEPSDWAETAPATTARTAKDFILTVWVVVLGRRRRRC